MLCFLQGANAAAVELGVVDEVSVKYWYSGSFTPTDEIKTKMSGWYTEGTEVVFSCGGGIYCLLWRCPRGQCQGHRRGR